MSSGRVFVAMPYTSDQRPEGSDHWKEVYQHLFCAAIRRAGYEPDRADEEVATRDLVEYTRRRIMEADLVLFDLSTLNANVMYEVGWADAVAKPVVVVYDNKTDVSRVLYFQARERYRYDYSLRPSSLDRDTGELAERISKTLEIPLDGGWRSSEPSQGLRREVRVAPISDIAGSGSDVGDGHDASMLLGVAYLDLRVEAVAATEYLVVSSAGAVELSRFMASVATEPHRLAGQLRVPKQDVLEFNARLSSARRKGIAVNAGHARARGDEPE